MKFKDALPYAFVALLCWGGSTDAEEASRGGSWYVYGGTLNNYENLLEGISPAMFDPEVEGDVPLWFSLHSTEVESTTLLGIGGSFCCQRGFTVDFNVDYGSATIEHLYREVVPPVGGPDGLPEIPEPGMEVLTEMEAEIFSGSLSGRLYLRRAGLFHPWLAAGLRVFHFEPEAEWNLRFDPLDLEMRAPFPGNSESVTELDFHAGAGVDVRLSEHFDLSFSGDHGLDFGWRAGARLVYKVGGGCNGGDVGSGGSGGRGRDHRDRSEDGPVEEDGDEREQEREGEPCGPFLPGEAPLPRISTPEMGPRSPVTVDPSALPAGATAHYPALDGDRAMVRFPAHPFAGWEAGDFLTEMLPRTLRAIGFEAGVGVLRKSAQIELPGGNFAALAAVVENEYRSDPMAFGPEGAAMVEVLRHRAAPNAAVDVALEDALGMSFEELVAEVERGETLVIFQQVVGEGEEVPIEHTGLLFSHSLDRGFSAQGALINDYLLANEPTLDDPVAAADRAMRELEGIQRVNLPREGEGPQLVALPYGSTPDGRIHLRYVYRMILVAQACQQEVPFLIWIDADNGSILKVEPLVTSAAKEKKRTATRRAKKEVEKKRVDAPATVYNRDPGFGKTTALLQLYVGEEGRISLEAEGLNRLDFKDEGFDEHEVTIPFRDGESPSFDQFPYNDASQSLCDSGTNKQFQQLHFFASLMRYRRYAAALGVDPVFSLAWKPAVESPMAGCDAWSSMSFGACEGYYHPECPNYSDGTNSLKNCLNFAHDSTVIAHEMGHNITAELTNRRPFDWCGEKTCALPVGWSALHHLADFWAGHLESTNCVGGWVCKNVGGVDAGLNCRSHAEGSGMPRLHELPLPFDPAAAGDHFPEHRRVAVGEYADMQILTAALWQVQVGLRSRSQTSGLFPFTVRFARALRKTGFLGLTPPDSDLGIYQYSYDLESTLVDAWATADDSTVSKVTAAFARAGLFLVPYSCLDDDPATFDSGFCPAGDHGGDAVIEIDDNDPTDDATIRGTRYPEVDYLELGGPPPTFHVWTGPLYRFDGGGMAVLAGPAPCNRRYRVEVSTQGTFPQEGTFDSGWREVHGDPSAAAPPGCYGTWAPRGEQWAKLQTGGSGSRLYYRVTTTDANGKNLRISTDPGGGLYSVPPPYAVLTADGTARD